MREKNKLINSELCPNSNKPCLQKEEVVGIRDILSDHELKLEKVSRNMEALNSSQSELRKTVEIVATSVSKMSESIAKVWEMNYADQRINLNEHSSIKVNIAKLDGKINDVQNKSTIANMKQDETYVNQELQDYRQVKKAKFGIRMDVIKTIVIALATWFALKTTNGMDFLIEGLKKIF